MIRKSKIVIVALLALLLAMNAMPVFATDTLNHSDFDLESWSKVVDFFDYVRSYAAEHNMTPPSEDLHAYLYLNYVNVSGMQMFYAGLSNITVDQNALTIPMQTFMMHYKSKDGLKHVVAASSFLMLLAFSEDSNSIYPSSPDRNDTLYASFSLGFDLSGQFGNSTPPSLNSKTEIIPLTSSPDKLTWHWGMKYTNLLAVWWKIGIDPEDPCFDPRPIAISRYDELTFTYDLILDPETGKATLRPNYIVGKMTDLWVLWWLRLLIPFPVHYNATGCYTLGGAKIASESIYSYLESLGIEMSIVQFQNTVILNHAAYSNSTLGNVTDNEVAVDDSTISTYADDGEKIFEADFASKSQYNLYNYTSDQTETDYETYNTTTRTAKINGYARNPVFNVHTSLMRLLALIVARINPELYQQAKDRLLAISHADYLYVVAYPVYSGYRIEHDPTYTAYCALTPPESPNKPTLPIVGIIAISAIAIAAVTIFIRKKH